MTVYVVTYDLNNETVRPDILADIRQGTWCQLSESCYAIQTAETAQAVYDRFKKHLDEDDSFYVIRLTRPLAGQGADEVNLWLQDEL